MSTGKPTPRRDVAATVLGALVLLIALMPALLAFTSVLGLGVHRRAEGWALSASASLLVFGPPVLSGFLVSRLRLITVGSVLGGWSIALLLAMPVYFPGERQRALVTGLALTGLGSDAGQLARSVADGLPPEWELSEPEVPEAVRFEENVSAASATYREDETELPYQGEGRRMSIPVVFEHEDREIETSMMLDTGATYTTLPTSALRELGIRISSSDPVIRLHTANGEREARVVLLDRVWLGDLYLEGVAIATCDGCASGGTLGLLGLNVTGGYNLTIDADHQLVVFSSRDQRNRHLDIKPFADIAAQVTRLPGGRVDVDVSVENHAGRPIARATTAISCDGEKWLVSVRDVESGSIEDSRRRLPEHEPCDRYGFALHSGAW